VNRQAVKEGTEFLNLAIFRSGQPGPAMKVQVQGKKTLIAGPGRVTARMRGVCRSRWAVRENGTPLAFGEQEGVAAAWHPQDQGVSKTRVFDQVFCEDWSVYEGLSDADTD
jgi:hypothetical protein